tara:strand:- start:4091 stop:5029 length:939 start_codon:yes stop_codon:yes gene_type:complete
MIKQFVNKNIKWVCHHAHIDKSQLISKNLLDKSNSHMCEKWYIMKDLKKDYTRTSLRDRMNKTIQGITSQNCNHIRTFIDVDNTVGLMCIEEALKIKNTWADKGVTIQLATQPLEGLAGKSENIKLFEKAAEMCDIVGCLPSRDKSNADEHLDIAFRTAERLQKPIEAHLDQLNIPIENETENFCKFVDKYNYKGKARSVHSISLACKPIDEQRDIAQYLCKLDIGVIICPSAAISMTQHSEYTSPIHNSIAPLRTLLESGVNVGLGIDNINDLFMPFCDGNLEFELRLLGEATRYYDLDILKKIAENKMGF